MFPEDKLYIIRNSVEPAVEAEGVTLVEMDFVRNPGSSVLKLYIDKEGGITVEDCARVSEQVGLVIEAGDVIEGSYALEVSSPGLTRKLKKPEDFIRARGRLAMLKLRRPLGKEQKPLVIIDEADDESVRVTLKDTGEKIEIPYANIAKANLEIEF